jgi:hypothetical protein
MIQMSPQSWSPHAFVLGFVFATSSLASATPQLLAIDLTAEARLGSAVAVDDDVIVVGAPDDSERAPLAGAVHVFRFRRGSWSREATLSGPPTAGFRAFGESVGVSRDIIVVGAPHDDPHGPASGAAYVYARKKDTWVLQARLAPNDPGPDRQFGDAVAIDGDTIAIGAYLDNQRARNAGAVYVFGRQGNRWRQIAKLTASDASEFAFFGAAISVKDRSIAVGAPTAETAYLFTFKFGKFRQEAILKPAQSPDSDYSAFGASVDLDKHAVVIGAPLDNTRELRSGAAYVYRRIGRHVIPQARLFSPKTEPEAEFGTSVAIDGSTLIVGAPFAGDRNQGAAYVHQLRSHRWRLGSALSPEAQSDAFFFGLAVDIDDRVAVFGAPAFAGVPGIVYTTKIGLH